MSQCIPISCKLYLLEVYQVLCGKSKEGKETWVIDELLGSRNSTSLQNSLTFTILTMS